MMGLSISWTARATFQVAGGGSAWGFESDFAKDVRVSCQHFYAGYRMEEFGQLGT